jgi:hypothetical protein
MSLALSNNTWRLFRALAGREAGRSCRSCGEAILPGGDRFGYSEGVCRPCRLEHG